MRITSLLPLLAGVKGACRKHENGETNCVWDILGDGGGYVGFEEHIDAVLNQRDEEYANMENVEAGLSLNYEKRRYIFK